MNHYIITFFTHFDAVSCARLLKKNGIDAVMAPIPRALSSSCGTCVQFQAASAATELIGDQFEQLFEIRGQEYCLLCDRREAD